MHEDKDENGEGEGEGESKGPVDSGGAEEVATERNHVTVGVEVDPLLVDELVGGAVDLGGGIR